MKVLFVGGTGIISTAVTRLAVSRGLELYHLNRGKRSSGVSGVQTLVADIQDPQSLYAVLENHRFDVVVDWIAYTPDDIDRDLNLFRGRVKQFIFISSASAYQKPPTSHIITESTPLHNPYWQYSRNKIACEERLMQAYRQEGFPITIVRPSHTYDQNLPVAVSGAGPYTLADRMKRGKPVIVHGDGSSLWVLTHSEDFARGFLGLVGNPQAVGHAFQITSDEVLNWNQIYQTIAGTLGVEANIVHISSDFINQISPDIGAGLIGDKAWSVIFDNTKIKSFVPEYQAVIPFREGIRRTLAWFDEDESRRVVNNDANDEMDRIVATYQAHSST